MPSSRKQRSRRSAEPVVFVDRSLGFHEVARRLRESGIEAHSIDEVFGKTAAEHMNDVEWIRYAAARGWIQFTKDQRVRYVPSELRAIKESRAKVFCLASKDLTVEEQVTHFLRNINRIKQRSQRPGPFVDKVYKDRVSKWFPSEK